MGVVVGIGSQNPRPFGFAQGRLCRRRRDKDGAPSGVEMSAGAGQPPFFRFRTSLLFLRDGLGNCSLQFVVGDHLQGLAIG